MEKSEEIKAPEKGLGVTKEETDKDKEYIEDSSLPEWIKKVDEFTYEVNTKEGIFVMEDVPEKKIKQARSKCTNPQTGQINVANLEYALISASLVEPKKGELDLLEYRGSTIQRLKFAVYKLYDMESFLSIQRN